MPQVKKPELNNLIEGREFFIYKDLDKVPVGSKTLYLVRRLARAEAICEFIPEWDKSKEKEFHAMWDLWQAARGKEEPFNANKTV